MKRNERRYHETVGKKVASVYIQENYFSKPVLFSDSDKEFTIYHYEYIGICVGNSRRSNNDWWNGDKEGRKILNKSTGSIATFLAIVDTLTIHILESILQYGYYCCEFKPTDTHRKVTYMKAIKHVCKKCNLSYHYVIEDDNEIMYWIE